MSQIRNIATELLAWGDQTAFLYRTTNELVYTNLSGHLHLLSAYMYRLADSPEGVSSFNTRVGDVVLLYADVIDALGFVPLSGMPTLAQVTTAGNTTTNAITVGGLTVDTDTLFVDATNNRVGIGTVSPSANLHVKSTGTVLNYVETTSTNGRVLSQFKSPVAYFDMRAYGSGFTSETWFGVNSANTLVLSSFGGQFVLGTYDSQSLTLGTNNTNRAVIFGASGNLAINTTTDAGYKLDVNGTTRFNGNSYINGNLGVGVGTPVQELHLLGTFRSQAKTGSDNVFFEGINSAGTMVAQMQEASSGGFGGLIFNGQRNNASGGNGIGFAGYIGTSTGNNAAIEFRAAGGTISSPTTHPTSVPIAKFCRLDTPTTLKDEFIIYGDGNIGINTTTNAGYKLDVVGADSRFNGVRVGLGAGNINDNIVIGSGFSANTTGDRSVVMGYGALAVMSTVSRSTAVGYRVGANSTIEITAFGYRALFANTTGTSNTAFGNGALEANTTGAHNTAFGYSTLSQNTTGTRNIAVGNYALAYKNVSDSIAIGFETIAFGAGSSTNIAIGSFTMRTVTGSNNVGIGYGILYNTSGSNNASFGTSSLYSNTTGSNNTALGYQAGYSNTTGANNIFIGYQSTGVLATDSNRTWIGNSSTTSTWIGGNLLVGTTTDAGYKLDVNGTFRTTSTITATLANVTTANVIYYDSSTGLMTYGAAPSGGGTPTLATVTTAGNTTTNSISVGGLTVANGAAPIAVFNSSNVGGTYVGIQYGGALKAAWGMGGNIIGGLSINDVGYWSSNAMAWEAGGAQRMFLTASGNLLINTISDNGNRLQVNGTIDGQGFASSGVPGYTGVFTVPTNPPGMQNLQITGGIITGVS